MISANGSMTRSFLWCHHGAVGTQQCTEAVQMIWAQIVCDCFVLREKGKGSIIIVFVKRDEERKQIKGDHQASQVQILQPSYYK